MITITEAAKARIKGLLEARDQEDLALRLEIASRRGGQFQYDFGFVGREFKAPDDRVVEAGDFEVFISAQSAPDLEGLTLDFHEDDFQSGFKIDNPNPVWSGDMAQAVQEVIDREINPAIASHGGVVSLLDVDAEQGIVYIQMGGGCQGCGMASVTLKQGVEVRILEAVPAVTQIIDTTDHAAGNNPFYQPAKGGGGGGASPFEG
jgi:Fe/S biogenesis protein NfuA